MMITSYVTSWWRLVVVVLATTRHVVASSPTSGLVANSDDSGCRQDLGMNTGSISDNAITASSAYDEKSVGPKNARIRTEKNGGAWCPRSQIGRDSYEWLEVDLGELHVISVVETQGRFGNGQGQEYAPNFMLDYQREPGTPWFRFRDRRGAELMKGNVNTFLAELRELRPPIVARRIRFVPYSSHPRTVCMRVELYGCPSTDGLLSYDMRQGERRGTDMEFFDFTYDGSVKDGLLAGGLGQLVDYEVGEANFRLDGQNLGRKGYEWVGWRNDSDPSSSLSMGISASKPVEIVFRFDQVRNFSAIVVVCNNMYSREVAVFRSARVYFSIDGVRYARSHILYEPLRDDLDAVRQVVVPIVPHRLAKYIRLVLAFNMRWIMISEVHFQSERVNTTANADDDVADDGQDSPIDETSFESDISESDDKEMFKDGGNPDIQPSDSRLSQSKTSSSSSVSALGDREMLEIEPRRRLDDTYVGIIVGALAVVIVLIIAVSLVIAIRLRRKKYGDTGGSTGSPSKFIYSRGVTGNGSSTCRVVVGSSVGEKSMMMATNNSIVVDLGNGLTHSKQLSRSDSRQRIGENGIGNFGNERFNAYASLNRPRDQVVMVPPVPPMDFPSSFGAVQSSALPPSYRSRLSMSTASLNVDDAVTKEDKGLDDDIVDGASIWDTFADLEFPRQNLALVEVLGNGIFGQVLLCDAAMPTSNKRQAKKQRVAVKTLRSTASKQLELSFFNEIEVMVGLQDPNLVQVLGICSRDGEPLSAVLEYTDLGDLHQFLVNSIPEQVAPSIINSSVQSYNVLSYGCLIYMATQIASGMKYLETLNVVHRDLATRNCLVGHKYAIKISDFGMSRSLYSVDYYHVEGKALVPIRWMAWESLLMDRFSSKTDVWSFAVTLWEILTFVRDRPYTPLTDAQVMDNCSRCASGRQLGVQLPQPSICPREIYDLMAECWQRDADQRPSFREIHMFLQRKNMGYSPTDEWRPLVDDVDDRNHVTSGNKCSRTSTSVAT